MADGEHGRSSYFRLPGVGSFVSDRLTDAIGLLSVLPDMGVTLRSIDSHMVSVDREVIRMREGVDKLETEVQELQAEIQDLRGALAGIGGDVEAMGVRLAGVEPHIESLGRLASPLRRGRRRSRELEREEEVAAAAALLFHDADTGLIELDDEL